MKTGYWVLAGVLLIAGGLASAQMPGGPGMGQGFAQHRPPMEQAFGLANGQFWNNPNLVKQLNLTDDQRKAMDGILQDHRMKLIDLRAALQKAEVAMIPLMKADTPNRSAIEAQIDKVVQARADLEKANARFLLDIRMQITPDQWKQLQTMREQRMQRERDGRDGRGWGPGMRGRDGEFQHQQGTPPAGGPPLTAPPPPPASGPSGSGDTQ
jgi:periplasmic protein CpxP/Spy